MKSTDARARKSLISFGVTALLAIGAATAQIATASAGTTGIDNSGSYRSEVQACMSGQTQQSREDCLKEARNAQADKARGRLDSYGNHQANAMDRCNVFSSGEDKAACQARVLGMGQIEGSVAGGGLLRESETVVLPSDQHAVTVMPQTNDTIVLVPSNNTSILGNRAE